MPKSYSQYKYSDILALGLTIELGSFFETYTIQNPSLLLAQILQANTRRFQGTEKAKSESIIAPILYEIALKNEAIISYFSGYNLDVNKELGLKGFCDFLFTKKPNSPVIQDPIFCIAEAKNDNLETGVPQCIAEMYAAQIFNKRQNKAINTIYGCVTTGYLWQFLKLENNNVFQDTTIYGLSDLPIILGILQNIVES
jgi:hypothetical protein